MTGVLWIWQIIGVYLGEEHKHQMLFMLYLDNTILFAIILFAISLKTGGYLLVSVSAYIC